MSYLDEPTPITRVYCLATPPGAVGPLPARCHQEPYHEGPHRAWKPAVGPAEEWPA